ncbi:hypothetical protein ACOJUR_08125 [Alicyclobacillus tolerans]|uniref:hypothetical protein n=1 Tax=Alicyclobacillus tolerans TaxID=90970 RepID=UPI003B80F5E0
MWMERQNSTDTTLTAHLNPLETQAYGFPEIRLVAEMSTEELQRMSAGIDAVYRVLLENGLGPDFPKRVGERVVVDIAADAEGGLHLTYHVPTEAKVPVEPQEDQEDEESDAIWLSFACFDDVLDYCQAYPCLPDAALLKYEGFYILDFLHQPEGDAWTRRWEYAVEKTWSAKELYENARWLMEFGAVERLCRAAGGGEKWV